MNTSVNTANLPDGSHCSEEAVPNRSEGLDDQITLVVVRLIRPLIVPFLIFLVSAVFFVGSQWNVFTGMRDGQTDIKIMLEKTLSDQRAATVALTDAVKNLDKKIENLTLSSASGKRSDVASPLLSMPSALPPSNAASVDMAPGEFIQPPG